MADSEFSQAISDQLRANGVAPGDLLIEVTEQVLMEASNSAMTGLRALRDLGVKVGLDDFGTRYSSLAYLRQFPLDFVKIDKSFIDDLTIDPKVRAIVGAIIVLSHALDLTVVAEGVELAGATPVSSSTWVVTACSRGSSCCLGRAGGNRSPRPPSAAHECRLFNAAAEVGPSPPPRPAPRAYRGLPSDFAPGKGLKAVDDRCIGRNGLFGVEDSRLS